MKTPITLIATALLSLSALNANAQFTFENEVSMFTGEEVRVAGFIVAELNMKQSTNGFAANFEAYNQQGISRYELEFSENNKDFSTVKRIATASSTNNNYKVELSNTMILANEVFYRLKIVSANGKIAYTQSKKMTVK